MVKDEIGRTAAECIPFYVYSEEERMKASKLAKLLNSKREDFKICKAPPPEKADDVLSAHARPNRIKRRHSGKKAKLHIGLLKKYQLGISIIYIPHEALYG